VVAAEVRALSQRTSTAAREVKQLIEAAASKVAEGNVQTRQARDTMDATVEAVRRANQLIAGISNAAKEQLAGISQVNAAVTELDGITHQNAAMVEQIAASAVALEGQAKSVADAVKVFKLRGDAQAVEPSAVELRKQARQAPVASSKPLAAAAPVKARSTTRLQPQAVTADDDWGSF
jgi:aerotaxis receptor